jgi:hypothetical protein
MNELVPVSDLQKMADAIAASKLFGTMNGEQALALMLVAQAEGLHPATVARDYHIIQGRPALKADAMLARYLNSGGKVEWHDHTDEKVSATFSHPNGGKLDISWDMERAKKAGLAAKDMWSKYPRQMLRARVISEGIRATNPAVASGIYTPEEVQDFIAADEPKKRGRVEKDITPESSTAAGSPASPPSTAAAPAAAAGPRLSEPQILELEAALYEKAGKRKRLLANVAKEYGEEVKDIAQIKQSDFADAMKFATA